MNNKGLTLIEVLLVIVVIGIVSAISVPSLTTILSNTNRDDILNTAVSIERAAKNYCRRDNYSSCPDGQVLTREDISEFLLNVDDDYEILVIITNGIRDILVVYAKEGEFSFPYNQAGLQQRTIIGGIDYPGVTPTTSTRESVNRPSSALDTLEWNQNLPFGAFFLYSMDSQPESLWQVRSDSLPANAPTVSDWENGLYQKITPQWERNNRYNKGDVVIFEGVRFTAILDDMSGLEPREDVGWQENTHLWREYNQYNIGDSVVHEGALFIAISDSITPERVPGTNEGRGFWDEITDEWRVHKVYQPEDIVRHTINDEIRWFVARTPIENGEMPGSSALWSEIELLEDIVVSTIVELYNTIQVWNQYVRYPEGVIVRISAEDNTEYQSLTENIALLPSENFVDVNDEETMGEPVWRLLE